ncbi:hypothetical protein QWI17_20470 [Gilvimarinus sp. SDUM040013]|uniref:Uncharacterized protein n=1 Tax=Gilvimarinus gilvus TaxID=3058038 RepID=A0ABU4RSB5_9GAMM|nr:hypothetical protein [Gilvimarinus sp. SDUM040013]MDO3388233.1 hypothetical protein [Gilvimarinus sp. SDUM040013]MDX6847783.1 hypothetical protein [Gilvimarinus sp. SDUM040013]
MKQTFVYGLLLAVSMLSVPVLAGDIKATMNLQTDALISNFDSKPDVDDLHSIAALSTILSQEPYASMTYLAVAGAYGQQDGVYIESPKLFNLAFGKNWVDAHNERDKALDKAATLAHKVLAGGGDLWLQDAGQADFSADLLRALRARMPELNTKRRVHIVQHSVWNESVTHPDKLTYARNYSDYVKIADGNGAGNGTPNYRVDDGQLWETVLGNPKVGAVWREAKRLADEYNGKTGYDNTSVGNGGFDFSDTVEAVWILGIENVDTVDNFFGRFLAPQ